MSGTEQRGETGGDERHGRWGVRRGESAWVLVVAVFRCRGESDGERQGEMRGMDDGELDGERARGCWRWRSSNVGERQGETRGMDDGELDKRHGGMNWRRSLSHIQSKRISDSKAIYSSESSRVSTPIPHTIIQAKSRNESCSKSNDQPTVAAFGPQGEAWDERRIEEDAWLYGKSKVLGIGKPATGSNEGWSENKWVLYGSKDGFFKKHGEWREEFKRKEESREEDGGESDSSSDLFELKNYDCGELSSGLPVHGTTDMEIIRRGVAAPSVPF